MPGFLIHLDLNGLTLAILAAVARHETHEIPTAENSLSMLAVTLGLGRDRATIGLATFSAFIREDCLCIGVC